jgi:hypothetical protein
MLMTHQCLNSLSEEKESADTILHPLLAFWHQNKNQKIIAAFNLLV